MKRAVLTIEVEFGENITDAEGVGDAVDTLLATSVSTPGILDDYGNPHIGQTYIQPAWVNVIERLMPQALCPYVEVFKDTWFKLLISRINKDLQE